MAKSNSKATKSVSARPSCTECGILNCYRAQAKFPGFCLTTGTDKAELEHTVSLYSSDPEAAKLSHAAAEIEGTFYGKLTRVEEIIEFSKRINAKRIGIATCIGLAKESQLFARILRNHGLEAYGVLCKIGSVDKTKIGIPQQHKIQKGCHEAMCNPIQQARLLNKWKSDLNVIVGLCVGHDSLVIRYSKAPVTTLITKDRVLAHNPAGALYTSGFYYKRLLDVPKKA